MTHPLCFVLMPFAKKTDQRGREIDFDRVYADVIRPSIERAGLEPLRADHDPAGGFIHKSMFEALVLCEYAVADLTVANTNVYYELGVRHAVRPWSTVLLSADPGRLPFDLAPVRVLPYALTATGVAEDATATVDALVALLEAAREAREDSPVYQLIDGMQAPLVPHQKTDLFRKRAAYSDAKRQELQRARSQGQGSVRAVADALGSVADAEVGVVLDLLLSFRAVSDWARMISLVADMAPPLRRTVLVQEQLGFALNRAGQRDQAQQVLQALVKDQRHSSETLGLLGRVHKDRWGDARASGDSEEAAGHLEQAITVYLEGYEADMRDAYPGINAVTLMELRDPPDPRAATLVPVVTYAVQRKMAQGDPDYWDYATLLELAVLARDEAGALTARRRALAAVREAFEPETTARNLGLICEHRERLGERLPWALEAVEALRRKAQRMDDGLQTG